MCLILIQWYIIVYEKYFSENGLFLVDSISIFNDIYFFYIYLYIAINNLFYY